MSVPIRNYVYSCSDCECKFQTDNEKETKCLACKIISDCKLPVDTIVNMNLVLLWKNGQYDKEKGMEEILAQVAEGVILLKGLDYEERLLYSTVSVMSSELSPNSIESYVTKLKGEPYDAIVVLRFSEKSDFHVFTVRYSKRMVKRIQSESNLFKKRLAFTIINNYFIKKSQKGSKE